MPKTRGPYDLIVVGGGIVGCGVARDAAMRGLSVLLIEKNDLGWGTTARSTRLVHGGLRYLEFLDLGLVREGLRERAALLSIAPHLVRPLPLLFPCFAGRGRPYWKLKLGMVLYDLLSRGNVGGRHRRLGRTELARQEPALDVADLRGGFRFYDCQVSYPERLALENALDAAARGATVLTHSEVVAPLVEYGRIVGVRTRDVLGGTEQTHRGRLVVNAGGPWVGEVDEALRSAEAAQPRLTKGIHLVTRPLTREALLVQAEGDRVFFIIPWQGLSLVGTTDTDFGGDNDTVAATAGDVQYLLNQVNETLDLALGPSDVLYTTAGLRALVAGRGRTATRTSRRHALLDHDREGTPRGLVTIVGGKITAYRSIAADVVDRVARRLGAPRRTRTLAEPLPGGRDFAGVAGVQASAEAAGVTLPPGWAARWAELYGGRSRELMERVREEPTLARPVPGGAALWAQVVFAVEREMARTLEDVLLRRTMAGLAADRGLAAAEPVARRMAPLLGWDEARVAREVEAYRRAVALMAPEPEQAPAALAGARPASRA